MKHKETFSSVMHSRAAKFTADVRAGKYDIPPVEIHAGNQAQLFKVGQLVKKHFGMGYDGVTFRILDAVRINGYWSYGLEDIDGKVNSMFARQDDLWGLARKE